MLKLAPLIIPLILCNSFLTPVQCDNFCVDSNTCLKYNLVEGLPEIFLSPLSEKIGHTWVNGVVWDKPLIQKFYSLLVEHNDYFVMLDLGAQTGSFSLLAKFFPNSQWHSFEPLKEAADTLKTNLALNDIHNVTVYPVATSNVSGTAILKMPPMNEWGLATIGSNVIRFNPLEERIVECIDLDSFVFNKQIKKVHFMKLDTEGSELNILKGAQKMIQRDHPIILMEYNDTNIRQCNVNKDEIGIFLQSLGYQWNLVSGEDILCVPIASSEIPEQ